MSTELRVVLLLIVVVALYEVGHLLLLGTGSVRVREPVLVNDEVLVTPSNEDPRIGRAEAERIAGGEFGGGLSPLRVWLGNYANSSGGYFHFDGLAWVVALKPDGRMVGSAGPPPGHRSVADKLTVVIDAKTGKFVEGHAISHVVNEGQHPAPAR